MDQHNIDRLFREKLDDYEITPAAKSWNEVEKRIGKKNKPFVYWIAASISLFLVAWVIWPKQDQAFVGIASLEIDHPVVVSEFEFGIPVAAEIQAVKPKVTPSKRVVKAQPQLVAVSDHEDLTKVVVDEPLIPEMDEKVIVVVEESDVLPYEGKEEMVETAEILEPDFSAVKITYIASNAAVEEPKTVKSDSTGVLKKFIAFTEKLDPGEMLADIKTAKDNLLSSGFKSKKDRAVMTP